MKDRAKRADATLIVAYVAVISLCFIGFSTLHYFDTRATTLAEVRRHADGMMKWLERNVLVSREALRLLADAPGETCDQAQMGSVVDTLLRSVTVEKIELGRGSQSLCVWRPDAARLDVARAHCAEPGQQDMDKMRLFVRGQDRWAMARIDAACLLTPLVLSLQSSGISVRLIQETLDGGAVGQGEAARPLSEAPGTMYVGGREEQFGFLITVPEWVTVQDWVRQLPLFAALFIAAGAIGWFGPLALMRRRMSIEGQVSQAIRRGDFYLVYLPTVDIETGEWTGVEALLRWRHPTHGLLQPASFIPWIERSPQIFETTRWVMQSAARDIARFNQGRTALDLSINVPPNQLSDPRLVSIAEEAFGTAPKSLERVIIELTEREMGDYSSEVVQEVVRRLKERGAQLALDDFGVGFSNFACLHAIDIDYIKVDKSFLQEGRGHEGEPNVMGSIVHLAREFDVTIIAEGVETERQLNRLRQYGVRIAQGFLFSRPLDAEGVVTTLREHQEAA